MPVVLLMVATDGVVLLQVPPLTVLERVMDEPGQNEAAPLSVPALGSGFTVIACVSDADPQPVVTVYDIIAVPVAIPVTLPVVFTVAIVGLAVVQLPPVPDVVNSVVALTHTVRALVMVPVAGAGDTVICMVSVAVPQLLTAV